MASGYTGNVQDFTQAHKNVTNVRNDVDSTLKSLAGQLSELEGAWAGRAATAFHQLMERFQADAQKLTTALQGISDQLQAAGSTYETQEEEHSSSFTGITGTLG